MMITTKRFACIAVFTAAFAASSMTHALTDDAVLKMLEKVVKEMDDTFPKRVDATTIAYAAQPDYRVKRRLVYYYQIEMHRNEIDDMQSFQSAVRQSSGNFYCSQPALKPFRDIGVSFEYNYVDNTKTYLFSNIIDKSDC